MDIYVIVFRKIVIFKFKYFINPDIFQILLDFRISGALSWLFGLGKIILLSAYGEYEVNALELLASTF